MLIKSIDESLYKHAISSCYLSHAHEQDLSLMLFVDERDSLVESNFDDEKR